MMTLSVPYWAWYPMVIFMGASTIADLLVKRLEIRNLKAAEKAAEEERERA